MDTEGKPVAEQATPQATVVQIAEARWRLRPPEPGSLAAQLAAIDRAFKEVFNHG